MCNCRKCSLDSTGFYWGCPNTVSAHGSRGRKPWHRIHGQMVSRVGKTSNLLSSCLAQRLLLRITLTDCRILLRNPSCFAKGACAEGRKLHGIAELIEPQLAEIQDYEISLRNNHSRPCKSQQMLGSDKRTVYYWTSQLTRAPCTCRSSFGADAHQKNVQTCSSMWNAGSGFAKLWDATLLKNFEMSPNRNLRPTWLDKSWQAVWNWNDHLQGHGIELHADECATYCSRGPITSFSFGRGGVLTIVPLQRKTSDKNVVSREWRCFGDVRQVSI